MVRAMQAFGCAALILLAAGASASAQVPATTRAEIGITLTPYNPPILLPDEGGNFGYAVAVTNEEQTAQIFDVWTVVTLPGGSEEPGYGPAHLELPDGWSAQDDRSQAIAGGMPEGVYTYTACAGVHPDEIWASDSFEFEKLPGTAGWYAQSAGTELDLTGVSFVDTQHGWAVSSYREIIHTEDGGDIWVPQDDGQYYPHE
ncbi:MAG: hypothetical protein GF330_08355, partial [Candidatus Eisenbacteria bacterium]|nr:hypothetical protein [Candidatus Eisenbacteria bacterium]